MARFDPTQPLVHPLPGPERVEVRPDLVYTHANGRALTMDLYLPTGRVPGTPLPAVLLVHGEADPTLLRGVRGWGQAGRPGACLLFEVVAEYKRSSAVQGAGHAGQG